MSEDLTVLLRIEGKFDQVISGLKGVEGAEKKVGEGAKKAAAESETAWGSMTKTAEKARAAWGAAQGTIGMVKGAFDIVKGAADSFASSNEEAGKKWKEAKAAWDKGFDSIRNGIGQIVVALSPLIGALGKVVQLVAEIGQLASGQAGGAATSWIGDQASAAIMATVEAQNRLTSASISRASQWLLQNGENGPAMPSWGGVKMSKESQLQDQLARGHISKKEYDREMAKLRGGGQFQLNAIELDGLSSANASYSMRSIYELGQVGPKDYDAIYNDRVSAYRARQQEIATYNRESLLGDMSRVVPDSDQVSKAFADLEKMKSERGQSKLESIFGPASEFELYAQGFDLLSSSMQGAFEVWKSGSASASEAAKAFVGNLIGGISSTMFAESIKHAAMAIGSLIPGITFNPLAAAGHAKAAAAFAAGALVTGGLARKYGSGGAGGGASAGGGAGSVPNFGGGGGGGQGTASNTTIILGDYFGQNPRERDQTVARALRSARREIRDEAGSRDE